MAAQADARLTPPLTDTLSLAARRKIVKAIDGHLGAADALICFLDQADGDTDLEPQCEDEGAQCEDEAAQCEGEGEDEHHLREGAL